MFSITQVLGSKLQGCGGSHKGVGEGLWRGKQGIQNPEPGQPVTAINSSGMITEMVRLSELIECYQVVRLCLLEAK